MTSLIIDKSNIKIFVEEDKYLFVYTDGKYYCNYINEIDIEPNNSLYKDYLSSIINNCIEGVKIILENEIYIFKFKINVFDEYVIIKIPTKDFLFHKEAMKKNLHNYILLVIIDIFRLILKFICVMFFISSVLAFFVILSEHLNCNN